MSPQPPIHPQAGDSGAASEGSRLRPALRRAVSRVGPVERAAKRAAAYARSRRGIAGPLGQPARPAPSAAATRPDVVPPKDFSDFFDMLSLDGDLDRAVVSLTRRLIARGNGADGGSQARVIAQVLHRYEPLRPVAEICLALCAVAEPMPEPAWTLFTRNDLGLVVRWAAEEYFRLGFQREPGTAASSLTRVLGGDVELDADPHVWIQIAYSSFAAEELELARRTLERAEAALPNVADPTRTERLHARLAAMREWLDRAARAAAPVDIPDGEIPVGLVGFSHPDWGSMSRDLDDPMESLAALGHLLRHDDVQFTGAPALVDAATRLRAEVPAERRVGGAQATVHLYEVDRDVSRYAAVPDGTWLVVSEWFTLPLDGAHYDMPLHATLRPIFISFHITPEQLRVPGVPDYLRDHGPIGCRDWDTVLLLHAAGVPAFFSGALVMTLDNALRPVDSAPPPPHTVFVGVAPDGPGVQRSRLSRAVKDGELGANLLAAHADLRRYRDGGERVVTSDLRLYLALRALGGRVEFRLDDAGDYRSVDFTELGDSDFAGLQRSLSDKLAAVFAAVLAGRSDKEVYEVWREVCAADIAAADERLRSFPDHPELSFDLGGVCAAIRSTRVVMERTEPGPGGPELNVEFSVDENYKHQLDIVLDSVVEHSSRPVRAFVLCRGHGPDDFERMARLFPTVSFVWLPTDRVDYGNVRGKIPWATIVTMDRTILPELLGDLDRIIHFDLDALCLSDLAELFDVDVDGKWIAAADEPQPSYGRGFDSLRDSARLLRREGRPDLAREYLIRTHAELSFDFDIFNAGVMVLNLAELRAGGFCGRYLAYVERFGINGQRVLNVGVGNDRKKIGADWNRLMRLEVADSPKIAHWAGPFKPWSGHPYVPGRELWRAQEERFAARAERLRAVEAGAR